MAQVNQGGVVKNIGTFTTKLLDFIKMNPLEFYSSKMDKDAQEFIN